MEQTLGNPGMPRNSDWILERSWEQTGLGVTDVDSGAARAAAAELPRGRGALSRLSPSPSMIVLPVNRVNSVLFSLLRMS